MRLFSRRLPGLPRLPRLPGLAAGAAAALFALPAQAQDITGDNLTLSGRILQNGGTENFFNAGMSSFDGSACLGNSCTSSGESNGSGNPPLKLKWTVPGIIFEDSSTSSFADRDWRLQVEGSAGTERFSLTDEGDDWETSIEVEVFSVEAGAPANAFRLADDGDVGFGTSLPQADLHVSDIAPAIRLDLISGGGFTPQVWEMENASSFNLVDVTDGKTPFRVYAGAETHMLVVSNLGGVGIGTHQPSARLHIADSAVPTQLLVEKGSPAGSVDGLVHLRTDTGEAMLLVEETSATTSPRTLLNMQNNGRPEIVMGNSNTGGEWSFGAGTNFILKQGAVGTTSAAKTKLFEVKANGDATLTGSLTTGGGTCGGGCDAVFTENRVIPAAQYHAQMWAQGFLPHVGPTPENAPFNVTEKLGGMLNALEHAHVYIDAQHRTIAELTARTETQEAAIAELRAAVADLRARQ